MQRSRLLWLVVCLIAAQATSQPATQPATTPATAPRVPGVRFDLTSKKEKYFVGEPISVEYRVTNLIEQPLWINTGGDYRGGRPERFYVRVTHESGERPPDLFRSGMAGGGISARRSIEGGEHWSRELNLHQWASFPWPGKYEVSVSHDLGWDHHLRSEAWKNPHDLRTASIVIEVNAPTEEQRKAMERSIRAWMGGDEIDAPRALHDGELMWEALADPIYVPLLIAAAAESGDPGPVEALRRVVTAETTDGLIYLMQVASGDTHSAVMRALDDRAPVSKLPNDLRYLELLREHNPGYVRRDEKLRATWRPRHTQLAREFAREVLRTADADWADDDRTRHAASLLTRLAEHSDLPLAIRALDARLKHGQRQAPTDLMGILTTGTHDAERLALAAIVAGAEPPETPASTGEIVVFLRVLMQEPGETNDAYVTQAEPWLNHELAYVRRLTTQAAPETSPDWLLRALPRLLESDDPELRRFAVGRLGRARDSTHLSTVVDLIEKSEDFRLVWVAVFAAEKMGYPRDELFDLLLSRFTKEQEKYFMREELHKMMWRLLNPEWSVRGSIGKLSPENREEVADAWRRFIENHREELQDGAPLTYRHRDVDLQMLAGSSVLRDKAGEYWPADRRPEPSKSLSSFHRVDPRNPRPIEELLKLERLIEEQRQ